MIAEKICRLPLMIIKIDHWKRPNVPVGEQRRRFPSTPSRFIGVEIVDLETFDSSYDCAQVCQVNCALPNLPIIWPGWTSNLTPAFPTTG